MLSIEIHMKPSDGGPRPRLDKGAFMNELHDYPIGGDFEEVVEL